MRRSLLALAAAVVGLAAAALLLRPAPDALPVDEAALDAALAPADLPLSAADTDVILAITCTLRRDRLQAYGIDRPTSPFSARLAASGVVFDNHIAQAPWTRPSIGATLTGRYPRTLGLDSPHGEDVFGMVLDPSHTTLAEVLQGAGYATIGAVGNPNAKAMFGLGQGFDTYDEPDQTFGAGIRDEMPSGGDLVDSVLAAIRQVPADQRIFAQVIFVDTHMPLQYRPRDLLLWPRIWTGFEPFRLDTYDASVRRLDSILARFLTEVRALRPNSLYVQTADHGEGLRHPTAKHLNSHGRTLYQSVIAVPHLWQHPALPPGRVDGTTRNIDVLPSILDVLGINPPAPLDGESYAAALTGTPLAPRLAISETYYLRYHRRALLNGQWHYIEDVREGTAELYRQDDPDARRDLVDDEPSIAWRMQKRLDAWEEDHPLAAPAEAAPIDDATRQMLEAMGYVEE